jgi:pimeloyl-ACP methyl ester carboxylesterase
LEKRVDDFIDYSLEEGGLTRRRLVQGLLAVLAPAVVATRAGAAAAPAVFRDDRRDQPNQSPVTSTTYAVPYSAAVLPAGVRSRFVDNSNGIKMHTLEAGFEAKGRPCVVLLHGFPELAYSWRKVMPRLAAVGYHVIAPDLRGYGRSGGWDVKYDDDLAPFRALNHVRDILGLVFAVGYRSVAALVGHDAGSGVAGWASIVRPDVFRSVVLMSSPFGGPPELPFDTDDAPKADRGSNTGGPSIYQELAALKPPRKQYGQYYATRQANEDMRNPPQGVHDFLRAYYHMKSADWQQNKPFRLKERTATELAKLPPYYMMELAKTMPQTVAPHMPSAEQIAANKWLPDDELRVYSTEYSRTGFQGGLQVYRMGSTDRFTAEAQTFAGRTIDVPSMFVSGKSDWGVFQGPGALERLQTKVCTKMLGTQLLEGAGHWADQEQPEQVTRLIVEFLQHKAQRTG